MPRNTDFFSNNLPGLNAKRSILSSPHLHCVTQEGTLLKSFVVDVYGEENFFPNSRKREGRNGVSVKRTRIKKSDYIMS